MRYNKLSSFQMKVALAALSALSFLSCSSDSVSSEGQGKDTPSGVFATIEGKSVAEETRSSLTYSDTQGMIFAWDSSVENKDHLTIFPDNNTGIKCDYELSNAIRPNYAEFTADGFSLSPNTKYFAFSKNEDTAGGETKIYSKSEIVMDFGGQKQSANGNTAHLGKYNYLASAAVSGETDDAHFSFKHLTSTLRIRLYMKEAETTPQQREDFKETTFTSLEMYDSGNSYAGTKRTFSFTCDKHVDANGMPRNDWYKYDAKGDPFSPTDGNKQRFSVKLGESGFQPDQTTGELTVYMEVPPTDLTGNTIGFILKGKKDDVEKTYYFSISGRPIEMGKLLKLGLKGSESTDFNVTLKVNHLWQHGQTRATGDPGYDDVHADPTHLYYFFCVDGKVIAKGTNHDVDGPLTGGIWSENKETHICTYSKEDAEHNVKPLVLPLVVDKTKIDNIATARLYVVAGNTDLKATSAPGMSYASITADAERKTSDQAFAGSSESAVQALTYNIISGSQEDTQAFMRDLYSTPWKDNATFVGALTDPMQDVILYHTAAKVDLKWNSTTALPIEGDYRYVKVNNVASTGLSIFKPTVNTGATGSYTVSTPFDEDTRYYGRQVYYLPQFNTYDVTVGSNVQDGSDESHPLVTFSPATTNGFTSWLRWLKNY
ncbi:MAG: hypothetical protein MJ110_06975 [Lachnospiraceae bacterium]|nr:hypothetical protein [Lachnospiraceae bacterium]